MNLDNQVTLSLLKPRLYIVCRRQLGLWNQLVPLGLLHLTPHLSDPLDP